VHTIGVVQAATSPPIAQLHVNVEASGRCQVIQLGPEDVAPSLVGQKAAVVLVVL
jgi:hypothetical protein